jgi:glycosyltransferase involved in cell wall biosynthesis
MQLQFSFIIPVYNRPEETQELLQSFMDLSDDKDFEIVIIEDGSTVSSKEVVESFQSSLNISYYQKPNSGPGDSRNYGMRKANGNYFIILDSDCILPTNYFQEVKKALEIEYVDCFGGPDAAHKSFSNIQKAINFSMTSFFTTGGIRGNAKSVNSFEPRSFNMGLSKDAFFKTSGFGQIHPGEDPDLSIRLTKLGFKTKLFAKAFVYHKRRISWSKFYTQVYKFGSVRPILNSWHPTTKKITYWLPTFFLFFVIISLVSLEFQFYLPIILLGFYYAIVFISSLLKTKQIGIAIQALLAVNIQFSGYGYGFIKSTLKLMVSNKSAEELFPKLFFKSL